MYFTRKQAVFMLTIGLCLLVVCGVVKREANADVVVDYGSFVYSLNGIGGAITIAPGTGISVTPVPSSKRIEIGSTWSLNGLVGEAEIGATPNGGLELTTNLLTTPQFTYGIDMTGSAEGYVLTDSSGVPVWEVAASGGGEVDTLDVASVNDSTGAVTLAAGSNVTITPSAPNTFTIASTGGGGGTTLTRAHYQMHYDADTLIFPFEFDRYMSGLNGSNFSGISSNDINPNLTSSGDQLVVNHFYRSSGFPASFDTLDIKVAYKAFTSGSGDIRWHVAAEMVKVLGSEDADFDPAANSDTLSVVRTKSADTVNYALHEETIELPITTEANDVLLHVAVQRTGSHSLDTYAHTAHIVGIEVWGH